MVFGLPRYIATVETSKHRFFTFLDQSILPDNKLIAIATDDAFVLGVLSSSLHIAWSLKCGSWLGVGNDSVYVKSRCFEPFSFPALEEGALKQRIRDLGERLDAHRKRQHEQHPGLTLTGMYNVLEKLRAGEALNAKEKQIHDHGLVTLLKQIHDELDAAVLEAYGWTDVKAGTVSPSGPANEPPLDHAVPHHDKDSSIRPASAGPLGDRSLPIAELLTRLVALNHQRAAEEQRGLIRWLRPEYQICSGGLRPSHDSRAADSSVVTSDGHRPPLQDELPRTETSSSQSKIVNRQS